MIVFIKRRFWLLFILLLTVHAVILYFSVARDTHTPDVLEWHDMPIFPLTHFLIYVVLIAPICEEIAFRSWLGKNKRWRIIGCTFFVAYCVFFGIHWLVIALFVLLMYLRYTQRNFPEAVAVFVSTIVFAYLHKLNQQIGADVLLLTIPYFMLGLALYLAYIKYGLAGSMGFHIANNFMVVLIGGTSVTFDDESHHITSSNYQLTITRHSIFAKPHIGGATYINGKVERSYINTTKLIKDLFPSNDSVVYMPYGSMNYYSYELIPLVKTLPLYENAALAEALHFSLDTLDQRLTPTYELQMVSRQAADSAVVKHRSVAALADDLFDYYNYPIRSKDTTALPYIYIDPAKPFSEIKSELERNHGLRFHKTMRLITFIAVSDG